MGNEVTFQKDEEVTIKGVRFVIVWASLRHKTLILRKKVIGTEGDE